MTYKSGITLGDALTLLDLIHEIRNGIEYFLSSDKSYREKYSLLDLDKNIQTIIKTLENLSKLYLDKPPSKTIKKAESEAMKSLEALENIFALYKEIPALYKFLEFTRWRKKENSSFSTLKKVVEQLEIATKNALKEIAEYTTETIPIDVSAQISSHINYHQIRKSPQSAIQLAFTVFEENLRNKLCVGSDIYGEELINQAFGKNGQLLFSQIPNEQMGFRNLISGFYATFRNSRMHRLSGDDENASLITVLFIDLLLQMVNLQEKNEKLQIAQNHESTGE